MSQRAASSVGSSIMTISTPKTSPMTPPTGEQSWQTLINNVLAFIDSHPRPYPYNRMENAFVPAEYSSRDSPLEVCVCEVCPAHPDFMVVGSYALVGKDDRKEHEAQMRKGTLTIMTVAPTFKATYAGMLPPNLDSKDFSSAILDLHFHPNDDSLLCVATSAASIHLFRLVKQANILNRRIDMTLLPVGWAKIAEDDEHGLTHLITQFAWLPEISTIGKEGVNDQLIVTLAATESSGRVQIVKMAVSGIRDVIDKRAEIFENDKPEKLAFSQVYLRNHDQEAWTVATIDIPSPPGTSNRILLSGGDDGALKTSLLNLSTASPESRPTLEILASPAMDAWADQKSYNGGVIAILPLPPTLVTSSPSFLETAIPLLTGSYDDTIRLYLINPSTMSHRLILDHRLGGGVWRLKLMDEYDVATTHHFIILVSCMHAGARILRVAYDTASSTGWSIEVIGRFEAGHASMVYSCDFRKEKGEGDYMVVSTSFYDKKICTWRFVDRVKKRLGEEQRILTETKSWEELGARGNSLRSASTSGWVKEDGKWKVS